MTASETAIFVTAIIGATTGITGAVLGIINTWHHLSRTRVRLRVIPKLALMAGGGAIVADQTTEAVADFLVSEENHAEHMSLVIRSGSAP